MLGTRTAKHAQVACPGVLTEHDQVVQSVTVQVEQQRIDGVVASGNGFEVGREQFHIGLLRRLLEARRHNFDDAHVLRQNVQEEIPAALVKSGRGVVGPSQRRLFEQVPPPVAVGVEEDCDTGQSGFRVRHVGHFHVVERLRRIRVQRDTAVGERRCSECRRGHRRAIEERRVGVALNHNADAHIVTRSEQTADGIQNRTKYAIVDFVPVQARPTVHCRAADDQQHTTGLCRVRRSAPQPHATIGNVVEVEFNLEVGQRERQAVVSRRDIARHGSRVLTIADDPCPHFVLPVEIGEALIEVVEESQCVTSMNTVAVHVTELRSADRRQLLIAEVRVAGDHTGCQRLDATAGEIHQPRDIVRADVGRDQIGSAIVVDVANCQRVWLIAGGECG